MVRKFVFSFCFLFVSLHYIYAERVGLVLSGGGAKGIAHIGVIQALEENQIPIDYITGTSIGAIIGSLYSMGYTSEEMRTLIKSDEFQRWYTGAIESGYKFYYKQPSPTPAIAKVEFATLDSVIVLRSFVNSLVNPTQMNLAFIDIYAAGTAACKSNFDSLMIPFRAITADVYNKRSIMLKDGDLGDAVRASMSFPLVFKPIRIDSLLAYDGGIYNNFPYDVMKSEFNPDFVIGCNVSGNEPIPDDYDVLGQIRAMIIQKSDYSLPDSAGIKMDLNLRHIGLLDFNKFDQIYDIGYNATIEIIDSLKSRVIEREDSLLLAEKRATFKSRLPKVQFKSIEVSGLQESRQIEYIKAGIQPDIDKEFDFETLKRGYFSLLSDDIIREIIPQATFNPLDSTYNLNLNVSLNENFQVEVGGALSSSVTSQIYGALSYKKLTSQSLLYKLEGQIGRTYYNAQLSSKIELPIKVPVSFQTQFAYNNINYFRYNYFFRGDINPAINKEIEFFFKLKLSRPFRNSHKAVFWFGGAHHKSFYLQGDNIILGRRYDITRTNALGVSVEFTGNSYNNISYPTSGSSESLVAHMFTASERFKPMSQWSSQWKNEPLSWLQLSCTLDGYSNIMKNVVLGRYFKAYYSTRNLSSNYMASVMQAGRFAPTVNSQLLFDPAFRANAYIAAGLKPIYILNNIMHIRSEFYIFMPMLPIINENQIAYYGEPFSSPQFMGELSLVAQYGKINCSLFVNFSSSQSTSSMFGVTLGVLMLNDRFFE